MVTIGKRFSLNTKSRKPNADATLNFSYRNFLEMSSKTADENFLLQKKIEKWFSINILKMDSIIQQRVTFSDRPYTEALLLRLSK
jgi:kynurenine 3-monooxygenase